MHEGGDAAQMKRRTKIVCGILLAAIIGIGVLTIWQWNNISAAFSFFRFSQEELEDKLKENDQKIKDAVDAVPDVSIRDITQEEKDALRDGTLTQEELIDSLTKPAEEAKPEPKPQPEKPQPQEKPEQPPEQKPEEDPKPKPQEPKPDYEKELAALIAEVYVLREEFLIKLDDLQNEAIAAYKAIPSEERTTKTVASLVSGYMSRGLDMEKECDARIETIVLKMETILQKSGGDLSIAQTVYDTYVEEKSLKKAWYMAELSKRGMI